ncbi:MAG: hypothetical protein ACXVC1_03215 [Tumebacillaceae bacterium]
MVAWVEKALNAQWPEFSYEETIKAKMLFLDYLSQAFEKIDQEEAKRFAEHLEAFHGDEQATLFAGTGKVPAPQAAIGNAMLTDQLLLFPAVIAAIELQNKGGKELLTALIVGLETTYRMGEHPQAELLGALLGVANAFELDEDGWQVLLGLVLRNHTAVPQAGITRGLLAHDLVLGGSLGRDEWSDTAVERSALPSEWLAALQQTSDKPGMTDFLMAKEVNADLIVTTFESRVRGKIPVEYANFYVDAVMALEDICCVTDNLFRR